MGLSKLIFRYDTAKVVRIFDKRLAILHYLLALLIASYVFYSLIVSKGYFETEKAIGATHIRLVPNSIEKQNVATLPYCSGADCVWWSESEIAIPLSTREMLITTHATSVMEELLCSTSEEFGKTCSWTVIPDSFTEHYIAGIDNVLIEIDHSGKAAVFNEQWLSASLLDDDDEEGLTKNIFAGTCKHMDGVMMNPRSAKQKVLKHFPSGELDTFRVSEILAAANVSLNGTHTVSQETFRKTGIILDIDLGYNNARCDGKLTCAFGTVPMNYRYRVYKIPDAKTSYDQVTMLNSTTRERHTKSGLVINVKQTGNLSRFSWNVFFVNFSSGLGLLAAATGVIDIIALFLLPEKKLYHDRKYAEVTPLGNITSSSSSPEEKKKKKKQ